ncbi:prolyl oligopeptidase family serine peptidase [Virgibacillus sp. NKC19-16]|uniref:alpha/beta fold hydrolase n=1 Tax=Virgibacillus salidurans TaxID=2831673 RepID=UPI001F444C61|nr:alpha/beta fold hydrolase [Virgibacillus sp. NKC19-16]UJL47610.1 prolyl oligopeptidase family serine peptidase [Virgibacillus sp. NKC19-16]
MIGVFDANIHTIPSLVVVDTEKQNQALPILTYFHGFTSAKEMNLPLAYLLAAKGYRVVLPDSQYHGEREREISSTKRQISFWDIVMQNVEELQTIKDFFHQKGLILDNRFGVAGTSMGGITTSAALTQYPWIKAAAVLMGSPKITTYAKTLVDSFKKMGDLPITEEMIGSLYKQLVHYDLSTQAEKLKERPLLFWHGENDGVVPFDHSYTFYEEARELYENSENIRFLKETNRDHKVSRYAILETVKWFEKHL